MIELTGRGEVGRETSAGLLARLTGMAKLGRIEVVPL